jgi:S1-C subfamily serine protease
MFGLNLEFKVHSLEIITKITVVDFDGNRHLDAQTIATDLVVDLCLLKSSYINKLPAKLSLNEAPIGGTVWHLAAPYAIFYPQAVPIFRGVMAGHDGTGPAAGAMYTDLPARPGCSGGGVFNPRGKLIGILHSTDVRMSEVAYGASREQLRCFLYQGFKMSDELRAAPALVGCKE